MLQQFYSDKTICIIGYFTLCGKILMKKLLKNIHFSGKLYLLDIDLGIKERELFLNNKYFNDIKELLIKTVKFINLQELEQLKSLDIVFNMFQPFDWSMMDKSMNCHVLITNNICQIFKKIQVKYCIMYSSIYSLLPGLISQNNEAESSISFVPNSNNFKQKMKTFLQENFQSNEQKWQWTLKYMQHSYRKSILRTTIVRVPLVGPTMSLNEAYIDRFNPISYLIYQIGTGFINYISAKKINLIDIVPADYVVNYFLIVAANQYGDVQEISQENNRVKQHPIHNFSTSSRNPLNLQKFADYVSKGWSQHQQINKIRVQQNAMVRKMLSIREELPNMAKSSLGRLMDIKSWKIESQQNVVAFQRKKQLIKKYKFVFSHEWICESNKSIDLFLRMTAQDQINFSFNVNDINWESYLRLCIYGIKKYMMGHQVEDFSPNRLDLLTIQKPSYFSDIIWAFTSGKDATSLKLQEIKNCILSTKSVQSEIKALIETQALKLQNTPTSYEKIQEEYQKIAEQICEQMFSQYQMKSIRMFAWFLHKTFKIIYEKVVIDQKAINLLKSHDEKTHGPLIIIPTHRSYIDFLIMSYIFFGNGIKCPHIAAAQDFLNMAIIHILLRRSGAFFIKRNQQKYKNLYKAIMNQYISKLLVDNHYLQFFIEGTRSRVGKMLGPKFGILSIICKNVQEGKIPDATILPITVNYEKVLEGSSFTYELMGEPKVKESLSRLVKAADALKQNYGRIYIQFCPTISVKSFFKGHLNDSFESTLNKLGSQIVHQLTDNLVVSAPAILATAVLMHRKGISDDFLNQQVNWICREIASRNIKVGRSQSYSSISVSNTLELLGEIVSKSRKNIFQVQLSLDQSSFTKIFTLTYYRNTLTHIFFQEAIVVTALRKFGYQNIIVSKISVDELYQETCFLYLILKEEYVLRNVLSDKMRFNQILDILCSKNIIRINENKIIALEPNGNYCNFCSSLIWPTIESYWGALLYFFKLIDSGRNIETTKSLAQIQWFIQSLIMQKIIQHIEAVSLDTIKNAVQKYKSLKFIQKIPGPQSSQIKIIAKQTQLKKFNYRIKSFLKSSYAQSIQGILQSGNGVVTLDFPFLSKL